MEATQAMNLSPIGNPAHETIRGVRFAMLSGAGLVAVLVTRGALEEIESPRPQKDGYLRRFEKHRNKFEQIASSKHQRGQVEVSRVVIVHAGDLALMNQRP
jgi:Protein of unknown function (DUF1488)